MKHKVKKFFLFLGICSLSLTGCSSEVIQGPQGEQGIPGQNGQDGKDGVSIVSIGKTSSLGNVDVYTITYSDGSTSDFTVTNGEIGPQGVQGEKGDDGHSPVITIGSNGNWYVDGVDSGFSSKGEKGDTGETGPQGPKGDKGDTGVSIIETYIDENGDLIVKFSDGTITNSGHVKDVETYTVNFYIEENLISSKTVVSGSKVSKPTSSETEGYDIVDWYFLDEENHGNFRFMA